MAKFTTLMLFFVGLIYFNLPNQAAAQQQSPERQLQANQIGNSSTNRGGISNYHKRLYDRVKSINRRTVRIQRYVIFGFIVLLIYIPVVVVFVVRHIPRPSSDSIQQPFLLRFLDAMKRKFNEVNNQLLAHDEEPSADNGNESPSTSEKNARSDA